MHFNDSPGEGANFAYLMSAGILLNAFHTDPSCYFTQLCWGSSLAQTFTSALELRSTSDSLSVSAEFGSFSAATVSMLASFSATSLTLCWCLPLLQRLLIPCSPIFITSCRPLTTIMFVSCLPVFVYRLLCTTAYRGY